MNKSEEIKKFLEQRLKVRINNVLKNMKSEGKNFEKIRKM